MTPYYSEGGITIYHGDCGEILPSLDPAFASDGETFRVARQMFEGLVGTEPGTADPAPLLAKSWEQSEDGLSYTFRIRPGIYFTPDPAFKGVKREMTAQDYVYSIKRLYNPALKSPWAYMFEGKIEGDEALKKWCFSSSRSIR